MQTSAASVSMVIAREQSPVSARAAAARRAGSLWVGGLAVISLLMTVGCADLNAVTETPISQAAVNRAHRFLGTEQHGTEILGFIHFGATYRNHAYVKTVSLGDGNFALVYRFNWESDGITDVAFRCDREGTVESVRIEQSNGELNRPFLLANLTINVLGRSVLDAFSGRMSSDDQQKVRSLIDKANARDLLEWSIRFQQLSAS